MTVFHIVEEQPISVTLRKAARVLRRRGWTQYEEAASDGAVCATRAIELSGGGWTALSFLRNEFLQGKLLLSVFNDRECQSANDVIALFEIGADIAECDERASIQGEAA